MQLQQLNILNYRNIRQADLDFSPNINCLIGNNGMGKTNILDAIYFLSFCKSIHTTNDSLNITHDADMMMVQGHYRRLDNDETISCGLKRGLKKHLKRNKKEYQRLADHIGLLPLVLISPKDSELITDSSEQRRKFIDGVISQTDKPYLNTLFAYNQLLRQRNALLKDENPDSGILDVIEMQMGQYGHELYKKRSAFIEHFTPIFQEFYSLIADSRQETVELNYTSHLQSQDLTADLNNLRQRDQLIGYTTHGIHRDELEMTLNGYPIKNTGSQGQQKTYLLALKLAQFEFLKQIHHFNPLLLLDDLFDKLDSQRVKHIVQLVNSERFGQIFITDTNLAHLDEMLKPLNMENRIFNVADGQVTISAD